MIFVNRHILVKCVSTSQESDPIFDYPAIKQLMAVIYIYIYIMYIYILLILRAK